MAKTFHFSILLAVLGCNSAPTGSMTASGRNQPDEYDVRYYSGNETTDFGNGSDLACKYSTVRRVVTDEEALELGFDLAAIRTRLVGSHDTSLHHLPSYCDEVELECESSLSVSVELIETYFVSGPVFGNREENDCPAYVEGWAFDTVVHLRSQDGTVEGGYYAQFALREGEEGDLLYSKTRTDLRNFVGSLPIQPDQERPHYASADVAIEIDSEGLVSGSFVPTVAYFPNSGGHHAEEVHLGPDSRFGNWEFDPGEETTFDPTSEHLTTLSDYSGANILPQFEVSVRLVAKSLEGVLGGDVEYTVLLDGEEVDSSTVSSGTQVNLGQLPLGRRLAVTARSPDEMEWTDVDILMDDYFVATGSCQEEGCEAAVDFLLSYRPADFAD